MNQRELARRAGVSQTTVSLALRAHPSIPEPTRRLILDLAREIGYRPNPLVASLMADIRSHRRATSESCIALLVDAADEREWFSYELFRTQYEGMRERARVLGFRTEVFFLGAEGMSPATIDRILHARGVRGLVLAGYRNHLLDLSAMRWANYACATISYTWDRPMVDRASAHHRHNMDLVFQRLVERGYRRIGVSLSPHAVTASDRNWLAGALVWNDRQPAKERIPIFVGEQVPATVEAFDRWRRKWRPDALVTLDGWEERWLRQLGLRAPGDIGLACANRYAGTRVSGVDEDHDLIGAAVIDLVSAKLMHNEYGLPARPQTTLIEGRWQEGTTLKPPA